MKKIIPLILTLLLLMPSFVFAKQEMDLQGIQDILSGKPTKSEINQLIVKLKKEIKNNPEDYNLYAILAFVYDYIGEYDNELVYSELAAKHFPADEEDGDIVFGNLARAYINVNKFDEAKPAIDKALSLNPDNVINHAHLLNYYIAKDKYRESAEELKLVSSLNKERDYYYDFYIYALDVLKKGGPSIIELFNEAVKINPDSHMSHRTYATALRNHSADIEKDFPIIIQELKKSLELNPRYILSYITIANAYMFKGLQTKNKTYFKEALKWFNKANKLEPKNVKLVYSMGNFFAHTEDYDKAIERLEYALSLRGDSDQILDRLADVYNGKAYSYFLKGRNLGKGLEAAEKGLKLRPKYPYLLGTKAELLYKLKRLDESNEYIERIVSTNPDSGLLAHFGFEQQKLGNYDLAERYYNESIKIDPKNIEAICNNGLIYTGKKEFEKAIGCYAEVIKILPNDFRGYYNIGIVYHNMGDNKKALEQVAKLREIKQDKFAEDLKKTIDSSKLVEGKEQY